MCSGNLGIRCVDRLSPQPIAVFGDRLQSAVSIKEIEVTNASVANSHSASEDGVDFHQRLYVGHDTFTGGRRYEFGSA